MPTAYCSVLFAETLFEKDEFYVTWNCRRPEKSDSFGQALAFVGIPVGNLKDGGFPGIPALRIPGAVVFTSGQYVYYVYQR